MSGAAPIDLAALSAAADAVFLRHRSREAGRFHGFVPADLRGAHDALALLRPRADSFVELGSGAGAITIVADLLGYDACGIEIEPWLVDAAVELAEDFDSSAQFTCGSFLPRGFRTDEWLDADFHVTYDGASSAWDEAGLDLADFDLVYAFPWPGEERLFDELLERYGRRGQLFLTYDAGEGFALRRNGERIALDRMRP